MTGAAIAAAVAGGVVSGGIGIAGSAMQGSNSARASRAAQRAQWQAQQDAIRYGGIADTRVNQLMAPFTALYGTGLQGLYDAMNAYGNGTNTLTAMLDPYKNAGYRGIAGVENSLQASNQLLTQLRLGLSPYTAAGRNALAQEQGYLNQGPTQFVAPNVSDVYANPEYRARMAAGQNAILQNASATGGLRGGASNDALSRYAGDLTGELYNTLYNRRMGETQWREMGRLNQIQNLAGLANTGLQANQIYGALGNQNLANQMQGYGALANLGYGAATDIGNALLNQAKFNAGIFGGFMNTGINAQNALAQSAWNMAHQAGPASQAAGAGTAASLWGNAMAQNNAAAGMFGGLGTALGGIAGAIPWDRIFGSQPQTVSDWYAAKMRG